MQQWNHEFKIQADCNVQSLVDLTQKAVTDDNMYFSNSCIQQT